MYRLIDTIRNEVSNYDDIDKRSAKVFALITEYEEETPFEYEVEKLDNGDLQIIRK